jgi:hypothetical protein
MTWPHGEGSLACLNVRPPTAEDHDVGLIDVVLSSSHQLPWVVFLKLSVVRCLPPHAPSSPRLPPTNRPYPSTPSFLTSLFLDPVVDPSFSTLAAPPPSDPPPRSSFRHRIRLHRPQRRRFLSLTAAPAQPASSTILTHDATTVVSHPEISNFRM